MYSRFIVDLDCPQTKNIYFILNAIKFNRKRGANKPRGGGGLGMNISLKSIDVYLRHQSICLKDYNV